VQTGLTSGVVLNLQPRFLLVPPALAATALRITGSLADPSNTAGTTEDAARPNYNSGVLNLYGPNGSRPLTAVVDACISVSESATAWYLAAEPNQIDTVEVCFLQGEELRSSIGRKASARTRCVTRSASRLEPRRSTIAGSIKATLNQCPSIRGWMMSPDEFFRRN